jgi:hypothetical protein
VAGEDLLGGLLGTSQEAAGEVMMTADSNAPAALASGGDPALLAGLAFFLGGAFVLALIAAAWYWRG